MPRSHIPPDPAIVHFYRARARAQRPPASEPAVPDQDIWSSTTFITQPVDASLVPSPARIVTNLSAWVAQFQRTDTPLLSTWITSPTHTLNYPQRFTYTWGTVVQTDQKSGTNDPVLDLFGELD